MNKGKTPAKQSRHELQCVDRSGQTVKVHNHQSGLFKFLYDCSAGGFILRGFIHPLPSKFVGAFLNSGASKVLIPLFVRRNSIDLSEYKPGPYKNFNAFFCRDILPEARKIDSSANSVISPCDGKIQVFPIDEGSGFEIKGIPYTIATLLKDSELAERYQGGTLMLIRLSVDDYHRYSYPVSGREKGSVKIKGRFHTVNPFAAERRAIYCENSREYSLIDTESIGTVLMMQVGALMVGKIVNKHAVGSVTRGEEKGYFRFGASSIVLCFEKDKIIPDADIVENTEKGIETKVRLGEKIAIF